MALTESCSPNVGGKFGHGFIAAGFTEALSPAVGQIKGDGFGAILSRTAVSAAIGGTASKLSGGSFANGAQTGAFQQLFNSWIHDVANPGTPGGFAVEATIGFGEGVHSAITFGMGDLNDVRWVFGTEYSPSDPIIHDGAKTIGLIHGSATLGLTGLGRGLSGGANSVFWSGTSNMARAAEMGVTLDLNP
jgi:hypothetical protein